MDEIERIVEYAMRTPIDTNPNVLRTMLMSLVSSYSPLPEVTEEDNGKSLTVINGNWDKAFTPDNSISLNKMVLGDIGYVTPEQFGAVGDGQTDDTAAIQAAINTHYPVVFGYGKTYIVIDFTLYNGCKLYGNGAMLKRPNLKESPYNYTDEQIDSLIMFNLNGDHLGPNTNDLWIEFHDLTIDFNGFTMWTPNIGENYKYESGVGIRVVGSSEHHRKLLIDNCTFLNNYASNISIANYCDVVITNSKSVDCFKGICTIVGSGGNLQLSNSFCISNYEFTTFWYEPNKSGKDENGYTVVNIDNCIFFGEFQGITNKRGTINITNCYIRGPSILFKPNQETSCHLTSVKIINTGIDENTGYIKIRGNGTILIDNCEFTSDYNDTIESYKDGIHFTYSTSLDYYTTAVFNNCIFHHLKTGITFGQSQLQHFKVSINHCIFKDITQRVIGARANNCSFDYCYISNCIFDTIGYIIYLNTQTGEKFPIFNGGNDIINASNYGIHGVGGSNIIFKNEIWSVPVNIIGATPYHGIGKRTTLVSETPTFTGINDIDFAELIVSPYTKYKYTNDEWVEVE